MKTLSVSITDKEYSKYGLKNDKLSFSELLKIVNREMQKLNLRKSIELAEKYGLSKLTTDEINNEITSVRKNAKNRT